MALERGAKVFPIARRSRWALWFAVAVAGFPLLLMLILPPLIGLGPEKVRLEIGEAGLRIAGSRYGQVIAHADTTFARRLTANDTPGYWPKLRTWGTGLPNYQAGWFQLQNGEKALLFVTDWSRTVVVPTSDGYMLIVSPEDPDGFLTALAAQKAAPQVSLASEPAGFPLAPAQGAGSIDIWMVLVAIGAALTLSLAACLFGLLWSAGRVRFEVSQEGLRIRGLYGRLIRRDAMDLKQARAVDLTKDASYRALLRTNGIGMPGYSEGWFKLERGEKALVFLTDRTRAVAIPTNLGYCVLFSPADPEGLLAALQE
jgi:hypothetical protein